MSVVASKDTISHWLLNDAAAELRKPNVVQKQTPAQTAPPRASGDAGGDPRSLVGMAVALAGFVDRLNAAPGAGTGAVSLNAAQAAYRASSNTASAAGPATATPATAVRAASAEGAAEDPILALKGEFDNLIYTLQSARQPSAGAPSTAGAQPQDLSGEVDGLVSDLLRIAGGFGRGVQQQAEIVAQVMPGPAEAAPQAASPAQTPASAPPAVEPERRGSFFAQVTERIQRHFDEL